MLFSSMVFIWIFLPIVIIGYYIIDHLPFRDADNKMSVKNYFLLGASLFFYAWGGIYYLLIMISSIVVNFFGGKYISLFENDKRQKKKVLIIAIVIDLGLLFVFKYFNMAVIVLENIIDPGKGSIIGMVGTGTLGLPEIVLPIGSTISGRPKVPVPTIPIIDPFPGSIMFSRTMTAILKYLNTKRRPRSITIAMISTFFFCLLSFSKREMYFPPKKLTTMLEIIIRR